MSSTIVAVAVVAALSAAHLRVRRHAGWTASPAGRFSILLGDACTAIAAYWLTSGSTWEFALGGVWAIAAAVAFVAGFSALRLVADRHAGTAAALETIQPADGAIRR